MIATRDSIETAESVDDDGDIDEEMRTTKMWINEESVRQNDAKNHMSEVAFWGVKSGFLSSKRGFFTLSDGFLFFRSITQKR